MGETLRHVYFVMENLETADIFQQFAVFLKLENYELVKIGDFIKNELPFGLNFPVLLSEHWFENPEFELEIQTKNNVFAGILEVQKQKNNFSSTGTSSVFNVKNSAEQIELTCTILIEEPMLGRRESAENRETQTDVMRKRDGQNQTTPPPSPPPTVSKTDSTTMTMDGQISLSEVEMEEIVMKNIELHLKNYHQRNQHLNADQNAPEEPKVEEVEEVEDPKPSVPGTSNLNSYNLVPRLTKLRDLDALISEKTRILEELELQIEVQRKIRKINEMREEIRKKAEPVSGKSEVSPSSSSSTSSTSTESTSSSTGSTESTSSLESSSESSSESTSSRNTSAKSSVKSNVPELPKASNEKKGEMEEESIDDPFSELHSSADASEIQEILSPASQYLADMRKRIAESYGFSQ